MLIHCVLLHSLVSKRLASLGLCVACLGQYNDTLQERLTAFFPLVPSVDETCHHREVQGVLSLQTYIANE